MTRPQRIVLALIAAVALVAAATPALAQIPRITSDGSLGPLGLYDGYYTYIFNTDAMTIDIYTPAGGYNVGAGCPPGTYTGPGDPDGCARVEAQPNGQNIVVWNFTTVDVATGFFVRGSRPAAIAATGAIHISGTVYAQNGYAGAPTPNTCPGGGTGCGAGIMGSGSGGGGGGAGPGWYVTVDVGGFTGYDPLAGGGGGGGGGAGPGTKGGDSRTLIDKNTGNPVWLAGGLAGAAYLVGIGPLDGGSGGGSGGDRPMWGGPQTYGGAAGGNGGGALLLATAGDLTISGTVSAAGSPGGNSNDGGGGGGGGGGFLAFQVGGTLTIAAGGQVTADGGIGGVGPGGQRNDSYGGTGGGGIVIIDAATVTNAGTISVAGGNPGIVAYGLTLNATNPGAGTIASQPGLVPAIACSASNGEVWGDCSQFYGTGTSVRLTVAPAVGSAFFGWTGDADCTDGVVTMNAPVHCTADFRRVPTMATGTPRNITTTTATSGGSLVWDGGMPVTARGVCWNTTGSPTLADTHTLDGSGPGGYISELTGLRPGRAYHVRAYATNAVGTGYGNELDFMTADGLAPLITSPASAIFPLIGISTFTVTATGDPPPTLSMTGTLPGGVTFNPATGVLTGTPVTLGTFHVTFTAFNDVNPTATQSFTLGVVKAVASLTLGPLNFVYDGTPKAVTVTTTPPGLSTVSVTYSGSPTPPTNAGAYSVIASLNNPTYTAPEATGTLVIAKATATLALGPLTFMYDGAPKPVAVTTTPPGLNGVSITYNGSPTPPSAIGSYTVVATLANTNYQAVNATGTLVIGSPTPTITALAPARVTTGSGPFTLIVSGTNFVNVATVLWNGSPRPTTFVNAGQLRASIAAADASAAGRVSVAVENGTPQSSASGSVVVGELGPDFNGDSKPDIIWRNRLTGDVAIWLMNGATMTSEVRLAAPPHPRWKIAAIADVDQDGKADLILRNGATGDNQVWYMNGTTFGRAEALRAVPDASWRLVAAADFNGDSKPDLVWRHAATGQNIVWFMDGAAFINYSWLPTVADENWQIAGADDVNADGRAEILWRNGRTGENIVWYMAGGSYSAYARLDSVAPEWVIASTGDFNGDGSADLVWRNQLTGEANLTYLDDSTVLGTVPLATMPDPEWDILHSADEARPGPGDFDADGHTDIAWRNLSTGENRIWYINGSARVAARPLDAQAGPNWRLVGTGDFDGDGRQDVVWRNISTGENKLWLMNGAARLSEATMTPVADVNWRIVASADFDADGKCDLVWRNAATGQNVVWFMNGSTMRSYALAPAVADVTWEIVGAGDFDGDGRPDLVWRNPTTGENVLWFMQGTTLLGYQRFQIVNDSSWKLATVGDYNGDGRSDLVWRNQVTGQNIIWFMNGATLSAYAWLPSETDLNWKIGPGL